MAPTSFLVLLTMLMGGGSDLLDYVPTTDYWEAKGVTVGVDALVKDLAPPAGGADISKQIQSLAAANRATRDAAAAEILAKGPGVVPQLQAATKVDDPEVAAGAKELIDQIQRGQKANTIRRLMAIRTLGEMKAKEALPALQELIRSDDVFVADYAKAAIAAIDGKPYERAHAAAADDAWLLPADTRAVIHFATRGGQPIDMDAVMKNVPPNPGVGPPGGGDVAAADPAAVRKQVVGQILAVAEKVGNIRLDGITVGVSGNVGPNQGTITVVARGRYDAAAVADLVGNIKAEGFKPEAKVVDGVTVFQPAQQVNFSFVSNDRAVLTAAPGGGNLPTDELLAAVRNNGGPLKAVPEMAKLVAGVDTKHPLWGVVHMTDAYRQAPLFAAFDTITVVGQPGGDKGDKIDFRFEGKGADAQKVADAVRQVNQGVAMGREQIKQMGDAVPPQMRPMMKVAADLMASIKCTAEDKDARLTGTVEATGPGSLMMFMMMGFRAEAHIDDDGPVRVEERRAVEVLPE